MVIGRVDGFRGRAGEMTVRVASGEASRWTDLRRVGLRAGVEARAEVGDDASYEVETARAYGERLVLKLRGLDDPNQVAGLRGRYVVAPADEIPALPEGVHYTAGLLGKLVVDTVSGPVGRIVDVLQTAGGADVLVIQAADGEEVLVPFARAIVAEVGADRVLVKMPEGLREVNRNSRSGGSSRERA